MKAEALGSFDKPKQLVENISSHPLRTFALTVTPIAVPESTRSPLSDDHSRFKLEIIPIGKNTHVEIRIPQFDFLTLNVQIRIV